MYLRVSSVVLILANLFPVVGVLVFEWNVLSILILYWAENVIIGILNVLKMTICQSDNYLQGVAQLAGQPVPEEEAEHLTYVPAKGAKPLVIPFFVIHYGGFCWGHLHFLLGFFSGGPRPLRAASSMLDLWDRSFWIAAAAIFFSHLYSFFANYIKRGEYKQVGLQVLMFRPYGRIIAMHLTIVFGVVLVLVLRTPAAMLLFVIGAKILIDLHAHEREREKLGAAD